MHLCREHFLLDVEHKVKKSIRTQGMLKKGDRIAVALSGGKDSSAVLHLLCALFSSRPSMEIFAITIDEGIRGYRRKTVKSAEKLAKSLGVEHRIFTFSDAYGTTLDELIEKGHPCTYCGVLRKTLLNKCAREMGATKLVTGHNLDDEAQTILMNYLRGDTERLARFYPERAHDGMVPRIKPLRDVPEKETALYAIIKDLPAAFSECPYARDSLRMEVRNLLNSYDSRHPGTKYSLVRGFERISGRIGFESDGGVNPNLDANASRNNYGVAPNRCRTCGEPSAGELCEACLLLKNKRADTATTGGRLS